MNIIRLSLLIDSTHIAIAGTRPGKVYLFYIRHQIVTRSRHNAEQHREHDELNLWLILLCYGHRRPSHIPGFLDCARRCYTHDYSSFTLCTPVLVLVHEQPYCAGAHLFQPRQSAWAWYGVLTLVKQTGLWGSNILGHRTDCLVRVRPEYQLLGK